MQLRSIRRKALTALLCGIAIAAIWFVIRFANLSSSIQNMPVYVRLSAMPAPPELLPMLRGKARPLSFRPLVLFQNATNPPVSKFDLEQIKRAIPTSKTIARLYRPNRITLEVESSSHAEAEFWRGRRPLFVSLIKTNETWQVERIYSAQYDFATPGTLWERISEALPF
jgi:hypothetical protein